MPNLQQIKSELRELVPVGLSDAIKALKVSLPDTSAKYQQVLVLEGRLNETNKDRLLGVLSDEQLRLAYNRLRIDLLTLISELTDEDLDPGRPGPVPGGKRATYGNVLYRVPDTMPLGKETKCIVRIALEKETIARNIDLDEHVQLKDIRVSDIMLVEMLDPAASPVFQIRSINRAEQFIEAGEYTEWLFYVMPQQTGLFPLLLKVSVIELIHERERRREIVLEENIQIVTEGPISEDVPAFRSAGYTLQLAPGSARPQPVPKIEIRPRSVPPGRSPVPVQSKGASVQSKPQTRSGASGSAGRRNLLLAALLLLVGAGWITYYFGSDSTFPTDQPNVACTEYSAGILGRLYYLSSPLVASREPERLAAFVQEHAAALGPQSAVCRCARQLGDYMVEQGVNTFTQLNSDRAYEYAIRSGASTAMAQDVAGSINDRALDAFQMGRELQWLSTVMPDAAEGNWQSFENTGTEERRLFLQMYPQLEAMLQDEQMGPVLQETLDQYQPLVEYQVAALARLLAEEE